MDLERNLQIISLLDLYGSLLSPHQYLVMENYFYNNLSLSEIAENLKISRQGVKDVIDRAENALKSYEDKLSLNRKASEIMALCSDLSEQDKAKLNKILYSK